MPSSAQKASPQALEHLAGQYFAPEGLYKKIKGLPFLGAIRCDTQSLTAGQWAELLVTYTVGGSGLADGAWIKGTFKFYSDWALFQTSDPVQDNYISVEYVAGPLLGGQTAATVRSLALRFDQKGHERPFQKAVIVDIVDGYLNPGDQILVRIGDRRWGSRGTRVQTFVEDEFLMRWYIDPVGTSRFASVKPDLAIRIVAGSIASAKIISPRVARPGELVPVHMHLQDKWGNATVDACDLVVELTLRKEGYLEPCFRELLTIPNHGWSVVSTKIVTPAEGDYTLNVFVREAKDHVIVTTQGYLSATSLLPIPRPLFADLHVHSDDTVGTNSTTYNFSYGQQIAGLDIIGYTANDFNITKQRWDSTLKIIRDMHSEGNLVIYPGTEWCGNSAAGGDHNVVFLGDPEDGSFEFPFDRNGNVARSFEWNEHGPAELVAGKWPLDELYATYAHSPETHLLIPHVGGRRCNLAWHHPQLERLLEIGSAWGLFEWLLRDAVKRGWKLGVCANSDEHRGRCGGGVPGTAVFGTKGGLTGVLADRLERASIAEALRARRTFATTGERLVGLLHNGEGVLQGDEWNVPAHKPVNLFYSIYGAAGFASVEAWDGRGKIWRRDLEEEASSGLLVGPKRKLRIKWGGARLYDRYREAVWRGSILITGAAVDFIKPFGGVTENPEDQIVLLSPSQITFATRTSGDFDGVEIFLRETDNLPTSVTVSGRLDGYVKVGDALIGNPHVPQSDFQLLAVGGELQEDGCKILNIKGGADLFVSIELVADVELPRRVDGAFSLDVSQRHSAGEQAVYLVGREYTGGKVITSPIFITYE